MFCFVIVCFSVLTVEPDESRGFNLIKLRAYLFVTPPMRLVKMVSFHANIVVMK